MKSSYRRDGAPRAAGRRPSVRRRYPDLSPGARCLPLPEFELTLTIGGRDHRVRPAPAEPGVDDLVRALELVPADGSPPVLASEWGEDLPRPGGPYRGLSCSCPEGARGRACDHLAALVRFGLLRPAAPADHWPDWCDEPLPLSLTGGGPAA